MKNFSTKVAVAIVAFFAVLAICGYVYYLKKEEMMIEALDRHMQLEMAQAETLESFKAEKLAQTEEGFATLPQKERQYAAADMFWGFYFMNTKARVNFCHEGGVDMAEFVAQFNERHAAEKAQAEKLYAQFDMNPQDMWKMAEKMDAISMVLEQDMMQAAYVLNKPLGEVCAYLNTTPPNLMDRVTFKNAMPTQWAALMGRE